jgi:NAD(P)-dependent dehydrogenase (short-subunit alcohol dehydrogenase family)
MPELDGQLAIVTRAASELAQILAEMLGRAGARLALVGSSREPAQPAVRKLMAKGVEAEAYECDSSEHSVHACLNTVASMQGEPSILVTCPHRPTVRPSTLISEAEFRETVNGNLVETFLWCQAAGKRMLEAGSGVIVNVTGLSGMGGWPGWLADSAAFGGVHNLTHTLATEWTRLGVRVNCLVPGVTKEMVSDLLKTPEAPDRDAVLRRIPAGRLATHDDLGKALIYLVRPEASFISGEILRVDGAWDVWGRYYAVDPHAAKR